VLPFAAALGVALLASPATSSTASALLASPATSSTAPALLARPATSSTAPAKHLFAVLDLEVLLHDYGFPGHPSAVGHSGLGTILRPSLELRPYEGVRVIAGAAVRLPMSLSFEEEVGALPVFALELSPLPYTTLRLGSLDPVHGFHPAISDELRQRYGRDLSEAYLRPLPNQPPGDGRGLGGDPWMPGEHGASLRFRSTILRAEAFLDWQLLETASHREKFAVGLLAELSVAIFELGAQLRLDHYGGERYTRSDPSRFRGEDPVRQPLSLAGTLGVLVLDLPALKIRLRGAVLAGRVLEHTTAPARTRVGFEPGVDLTAFELITLGYRGYFTKNAGSLSELGDPIYRQAGAQRVSVAGRLEVGPVELRSGLDLVFPHHTREVQYIFATTALLHLETPVL